MKKPLKVFGNKAMSLIIACKSTAFAHDTVVGNSQIEFEIKNIIVNYFEDELKSIQTSTPRTSSNLIKNSKFEEQVSLNNKIKAEWYKKIDEKLVDYKLYLDYNSISFKNDNYIVNLNKGVELVFKNSADITQQIRKENHIIVIKRYNDTWFIEKDIFEENEQANRVLVKNLINEDSYVNDKVKFLQERYSNIDSIVKEYKNTIIPAKKESIQNGKIGRVIYNNYNGETAANYAVKHYNDAEEYQYNDCANFVSRCINIAGINASTTWKPGLNTWISAIELRNYLVNNGIAKEYGEQSNCKRGDLIMFKHPDRPDYSRSLIITCISLSGQVFVSAHSNAACNVALFNYYPTSKWDSIRYLKLTT